MRTAPIDIEPGYRAYWLARLRWIASSAIIYGTFVASSVLGLPLDPLPLYLVGAAVAMYNSLFVVGLKLGEVGTRESGLRSARRFANGQIAADLVALAILVHFTGGSESPLAFFFVLHVIIASVLLSPRETYLQSTFACLLYGGLAAAELGGRIPHVHLLGSTSHDLSRDPQFVTIVLVSFASAVYGASYLSTSVASRLRRRDRDNLDLIAEIEEKDTELTTIRQSLARLEGIETRRLRDISRGIQPQLASLHDRLASLLDGTEGEISPAQRALIARSAKSVEGMLSMTSGLLALSLAREAGCSAGHKPVDLDEIVRRVVAAQSSAATARGITLSVEGSLHRAKVNGDVAALEQLLFHLVSNAVSYTLVGGRVDVRMESLDQEVRLTVADTGIGIAPADLPRVFDEFYRSENARRYRVEGAGLGLPIARSVVAGHGGRIDVESQLGIGTTVTVLLPSIAERIRDDAPEPDPEIAQAVG